MEHLALCDTPVFGLLTLPKGCYCVCLDEQTLTEDDDGLSSERGEIQMIELLIFSDPHTKREAEL